MKVLKEYHRLYTENYFIADCLGGRAGARSYSISQKALHDILHETNFVGFLLRQTHSTIYSSIWKDFNLRIKEYEEIHKVDLSKILKVSDNNQGENTCLNLITGGILKTKGFQTSSGQITGSLKSLADATHLYNEEADEVNEKDFLKVKMSLRKKGVNLKILRAFNPPQKDHWIWKDYILQPLSNEQLYEEIIKVTNDKDFSKIKDICDRNEMVFYKPLRPKKNNHICIITNYYNNYKNLNETAIDEYDSLKYKDFYDYCTTVLGLIPKSGQGSIYSNYFIEKFPEEEKPLHGFGLDFGSNDPDALTEIKIDPSIKTIWIKLRYCKNNTSVDDLFKILKNTCGYSSRIVADAAERRLIRDYYHKGLNIHKADKRIPVETQIKHLRSWKLIIDDDTTEYRVGDKNYNLVNCFDNYEWHDKKAGVIKHEYSDPMDSWRYIAMDLLNIK
jgi:phage terminase large subunit